MLQSHDGDEGDKSTVSTSHFHAREAAAALLKMAQMTPDPKVAAGLIEAAAALKDQSGDLPRPSSVRPPDVQTTD
jgi:hypothetical protein